METSRFVMTENFQQPPKTDARTWMLVVNMKLKSTTHVKIRMSTHAVQSIFRFGEKTSHLEYAQVIYAKPNQMSFCGTKLMFIYLLTDQRCRSFDQIKYTVTHTGMSCNSALKVFSSFIMQLFCLIFFLVTYRKFV